MKYYYEIEDNGIPVTISLKCDYNENEKVYEDEPIPKREDSEK